MPTVLLLPAGHWHRRLFPTPAALARLRTQAHVLERPDDERSYTAAELGDLIEDASACIVGWGGGLERLSDDVLAKASRLRLVASAMFAPGLRARAADLNARGIRVVDCSWPVQWSVAEYVLGVIITSLRRLWEHDPALRAGRPWRDPTLVPNEPVDSCIGVVGAGRVGRAVIRALRPWQPRILVADPYVDAADVADLGAELVPLPELLRTADVVTLHVPREAATRGLIGRAELALLRDGAILVNTARAAVVEEAALVEELRRERIRAVLDVFDPEPPPSDHPFFRLPNVLVTPHLAGHTPKMAARCGTAAVDAVLEAIASGTLDS